MTCTQMSSDTCCFCLHCMFVVRTLFGGCDGVSLVGGEPTLMLGWAAVPPRRTIFNLIFIIFISLPLKFQVCPTSHEEWRLNPVFCLPILHCSNSSYNFFFNQPAEWESSSLICLLAVGYFCILQVFFSHYLKKN